MGKDELRKVSVPCDIDMNWVIFDVERRGTSLQKVFLIFTKEVVRRCSRI